MEDRGSTSLASDKNRRLVRSGAQVSQQMMIPQLGPCVPPYHQERSVVSIRNNLNQHFGLPQPRWLVVDHFYTDGFGLYSAALRSFRITPLL